MNYLEKAEKALSYLAESETEYARLKSEHLAHKEVLRIVESSLIMDSDIKAQGMKAHAAKASTDYQEAVNLWRQTIEEYELISARRKRAELTIEMYRSVNSALKRGNI